MEKYDIFKNLVHARETKIFLHIFESKKVPNFID